MALILFDNQFSQQLHPLTLTRAVGALRCGILTMQERWALQAQQEVFIHTAPYLQPLYPLPGSGNHLWIDASVYPSKELLQSILSLSPGQCITDEMGLVAGCLKDSSQVFNATDPLSQFSDIQNISRTERILYAWQLVQWNDRMLRDDFNLLTTGRSSQPIPPSNRITNAPQIFIEEGAIVEHAVLNATTGPIYIGKQAEIMEGSCIRGPFAMGFQSVLKMNARVYGATTLGPSCMAGGEIKNSILMGYCNKAHDGYLGDSVIGAWCNFGAGSSNSNLKNTAGNIEMTDPMNQERVGVGAKFGCIVGDYSRMAINSSINTGSVIGVCCNVYGQGLLPRHIPDFSWGVDGKKYEWAKAMNDIDNWKKLKGASLTAEETSLLQAIFTR